MSVDKSNDVHEHTGTTPPVPEASPQQQATLDAGPGGEDDIASCHSQHDSNDVSQRTKTPSNDISSESQTIVVDWNGPDDLGNPKNWPYSRKWAATITISSFTFVSPLASSMIAPATTQLIEPFGIKSTVVEALTVSTFVLAFAFGPLFLGPLSEIFGRVSVLQIANIWFLAWNIACGFAQSAGQLIAFRLLAGLGGSAPLSIGGAAISDMWAPEERGRAIAIYSLAPLMGPVIGPIIGAWIAEKTTWRWVFWSLSIFDAVIFVSGIFFLQETYAPVLLELRAKNLRKEMGMKDLESGLQSNNSEKKEAIFQPQGNTTRVRTIYEGDDRRWKTIFSKALTRPFALYVREPIVQVLGLYMAFIYGILYLCLTTIPSIYQGTYHQTPGIAGLNYIGLGIGLTMASQINARLLDKIYVQMKSKNNGVGKPEYRLPSMFPATIMLPLGLLLAGWGAQNKLHWIVPDIGLVFIGGGMILTFQSVQIYVVDTFTLHAASALAAVNCLRSLAGFGFPLFAPAMYASLGYGKGDTILACVAIVIGCPAPWLLWIYGERLRKASRYSKK